MPEKKNGIGDGSWMLSALTLSMSSNWEMAAFALINVLLERDVGDRYIGGTYWRYVSVSWKFIILCTSKHALAVQYFAIHCEEHPHVIAK